MRFIFPFLLLWGFSVFADDNLVRDASFEAPAVTARTPASAGGDPTGLGKVHEWISFKVAATGSTGTIQGGLTNEVAHTGRQSLFIKFDHVTDPYKSAVLTSNFIPVVAGTNYQIGMWGRTDAKDAIDPDGKSVYLKVQVDYFAKDAFQSVGETFYAVQPLPGSKNHPPVFTPIKWYRFHTYLNTPPDAVFAQITWRWETGSDPGEVTGTMYFDDAELIGPQVANPDLTPDAVAEPAPEPEMTGTDAASPAMSPAAAASPDAASTPDASPSAAPMGQ